MTTETYETAVSSLSTIIGQSESSTTEQNSEVLDTVANYTAELASFVDDSNVIINNTVSIIYWAEAQEDKFNIITWLVTLGCSRCGRSCEFSPSVEPSKHCSSQ